jgi:hypothetical protein
MTDNANPTSPTVTINGKTYSAADLSPEARSLVLHIQAVDVEINRLKMQMNIAQTARRAYLNALTQALPDAAGQQG